MFSSSPLLWSQFELLLKNPIIFLNKNYNGVWNYPEALPRLCSGTEQAFEGTGAFSIAVCWAGAIAEDYMNYMHIPADIQKKTKTQPNIHILKIDAEWLHFSLNQTAKE